MNDKMKLLAFSLVLVLLMACTNRRSDTENNPGFQQPAAGKEVPVNRKVQLEVKAYENDSIISGWGYDIYADGILYIHQPNIPAVPGNRRFKSEKDALVAGNFAVYKINNNIIPPTISVDELDSLGVLKLNNLKQ